MHEILGPLGLDKSISRRVAGALLQSESDFVKNPPSARSPSWLATFLRKLARTPSDLAKGLPNGLEASEASLSGEEQNLKVGDQDVGMTAFLLKFGEGEEDVPTSRLWISALTIGMGYLVAGLVPPGA